MIYVFCFLIALLGILKEKNIYNPLFVFFLIWGFAIAGAKMQLYNIYEVSDETYTIVFIGLLSFFIGYMVIDIFFIKKFTPRNNLNFENFKKTNPNNFNLNLNYKYIYVFAFCALIFFGSSAIKALQILIDGNTFHYIRTISSDDVLAGSPIIRSLRAYIFVPGLSILIIISAIDLIVGKKDKKLFLLTFIISLLQTLSTGGRITFLNFIFYIILSRLIFNRKIKINKKTKIIINISTVIIIFLFIFISKSRGITSLTSSLYFYLSGAFPHLDYRLGVIDAMEYQTYGFAALNGLFTSIFFILKNLGITNYPVLFQETVQYINVENFVSIGQNVYFNAFVTPFFYFYLDGRYIGVILGSFLYGIIASLSYNNMKRNLTLKHILLFMIVIQGLATSIIRFQFIDMAYFLSFVYVLFLFRKRRIKIKLK